MRHPCASVVAALTLVACAAEPAPPPRTAGDFSLPALQRQRLNRVHADAPEVSELVVRLRRLAQARAEAGDVAAARELAAHAQTVLLASSELIARMHEAEARAQARAAAPAAATPPPEAADDEERAPPPRARPRRRRRARVAAAPDEAPSAPDAAPASEEDQAAVLSQRLARLASLLSEIDADDANRVVLEGAQSRLIEADRALAEGMVRRAGELAVEAEQLLASLGGRAPAPSPATEQSAFLRDARERLGGRARVHGGAVGYRLDGAVVYEDGSWRGRGGSLGELRALARTYRDASLTLVTVGAPTAEAFADEREELAAFLATHLRIPSERIRWGEPAWALDRGTYVVLSVNGP